MPDRTLISRRLFLASGTALGGGLLVAVSLSENLISPGIAAGSAKKANSGFNPSAYIEIRPDGRTVLTIGKSEMGQGTLTGIAQLIADELECDWQKIEFVQARAAREFGFPFNGFMITGGSSSLRTEWMRMRMMGAAARIMLLNAAAARWGVDPKTLEAKNSVVRGPKGQIASFGDLAAAAATLDVPDRPVLKSKNRRTLIGASVKRLDTGAKITGTARYGMDVDIDGMLTAIVISPPQLSAPVVSFDGAKALARPGVVAVEQISTGIAVIGAHYWAVHSARGDVAINWGKGPFAGLGMEEIRRRYTQALGQSGKIGQAKGNVAGISSGKSITREFEQPYLAHACMEPMNCTVAIKPDRAEVWAPTQAQNFVQRRVGKIAGIDPKKVIVNTTFLGGGFGRRSAVDFVQAAAEISKKTGRPVKLVYSREDDMRAGRYRSFNLTRATGSLDVAGNLAALDIKIATPSVSKWSGLMFLIRKDGVDEQAVEGLVNLPYAVPNVRVEWVDHDPKVPVHFWRAVGSSHNPFVVESLLDDLAKAAGRDPLVFRRHLLKDKPRHLAVLDRLARESRWDRPATNGSGRGLALVESFGSIVGQSAEIRIIDGDVRVDKVTCVIDCGVAINPGQIEAQMESSIVYGLSALLRGQITIDDGAVEQSNFHDYAPLRLSEMPDIDVHIIEGNDKPGGVGEPGLPPLLPAVSNAIFALTGRRVTQLPLQR